jgi:hypothetical protein
MVLRRAIFYRHAPENLSNSLQPGFVGGRLTVKSK